MKFIHLSDLHLGKRIHGFSMLEDQKYILEQIIQIVKQEQADGVLLAGDLYDKPVPPIEAVQELDRFLTGLASLGISVFAVSGNHDSAERIAFGARLMQERDIYLSPAYDGSTAKICVEDEYGEVWIHLLLMLLSNQRLCATRTRRRIFRLTRTQYRQQYGTWK